MKKRQTDTDRQTGRQTNEIARSTEVGFEFFVPHLDFRFGRGIVVGAVVRQGNADIHGCMCVLTRNEEGMRLLGLRGLALELLRHLRIR